MMTEFVILVNSWGDETMTDEERDQLEELLEASGYRPDWGEGPEVPAAWEVRGTRAGEAEGEYYRQGFGSGLQIMGYTIPAPDGFDVVVSAAFEAIY